MIRLDSTTRSLRVVLASAVTTSQLPVTASYSDKTSAAYTGATQLTNTNGTTAVTIVSSPAASTVRDIDYISLRNSDTAIATATVQLVDTAAATTTIIASVQLQVGDNLTFTHAQGWQVLSASGSVRTVASAVTQGWSSQTFTGDGSTTVFTLSSSALLAVNLEVYINGVHQVPTTDYTLSGSTVTFVTAPPNTTTIFTRWATTIQLGTASGLSVTASTSTATYYPILSSLTSGTVPPVTSVNFALVPSTGTLSVGNNAPILSERLLVKGAQLGSTLGNSQLNAAFYAPDTTNVTRLQIGDYRIAAGSTHVSSENHIQRIVDTTLFGYLGFGSGTNCITFGYQSTQLAQFDTSGILYVGTTSVTPNPGVVIAPTGVINLGNSAGASGFSFASFIRSGVNIGSIQQSGTTAVVYNTTSDHRLKTNVQPMVAPLDRVMQLNPVTYNWVTDNVPGEGFIAHELQTVVPTAVTGEKDAVNEDGSIKAQMVDYSKVVALLTAAIQELKAEFDAYRATHP